MLLQEGQMAMRTWPLWLAHRGVTVGRGFIAGVEVTGRLVAHQDSTGIWLEGVTPAGLVLDAGASSIEEVQPLLREALVGALDVFANDAASFGEFRDAVQAFLSTTDEAALEEWRGAVERVRSTQERPDGLDVWSADRETSVSIAEMAVEDLTPVETAPPTDYLRTAAIVASEIRIPDVLKMLEACAPTHRVVETTHSFLVKSTSGPGVVTAVFPSGPHLKLERRRIRSSAVKALARKLGILDCARRHLPL